MAFWGLEVKPKKQAKLSIERRLVIKQAALVIEKPSKEPCVLSVSTSGSEQTYVVCRLHEGRLEHCTLELPFSPNDGATLHLTGPHTVHLTGFLDMEEEDEWDEEDGEKAPNGTAADDDDEDDEDDESYDEEDGEEEDDDDEDDDDDDDDDEDDDDDDDDDDDEDEDEEEEVAVAPKKRAAPAPPPAKKAKEEPPAKKAKAEAPPAAGAAPNAWTKEEEAKFAKATKQFPDGTEGRWDKIAAAVGTRTKQQCKKKAKA